MPVQPFFIVQNDILFGTALDVLKELRNLNQSQVLHLQRAWIPGIQGNRKNPIEFGNGTPQHPRHHKYAEVASSSFRMVALMAAGVGVNLWPAVHRNPKSIGGQRNRSNLQNEPDVLQFHYSTNQQEVDEFIAHFDQMFPHMLIRTRMEQAGVGNRIDLAGKVGDLKEVSVFCTYIPIRYCCFVFDYHDANVMAGFARSDRWTKMLLRTKLWKSIITFTIIIRLNEHEKLKKTALRLPRTPAGFKFLDIPGGYQRNLRCLYVSDS